MIAALHLMISGRVQGVGFRPLVYRIAQACAVARHGPRGAIVTSIEQRAATAAEEDDALGAEFEARPTE